MKTDQEAELEAGKKGEKDEEEYEPMSGAAFNVTTNATPGDYGAQQLNTSNRHYNAVCLRPADDWYRRQCGPHVDRRSNNVEQNDESRRRRSDYTDRDSRYSYKKSAMLFGSSFNRAARI